MFCKNCGKELEEGQKNCSSCGTNVENAIGNQNNSNAVQLNTTYTDSISLSQIQTKLLNELIKKIKNNAIIWLAIAALQIIFGLLYNWIILVVGALNLISSLRDIQYAKSLMANPVGIVKKYKPIVEPIITLGYNLIFGGVIGVAGSIYYLLAIRTFVINNEHEFNCIESSREALDA